ncbi:MAG: SRPBCC family protein [Beijerinckiaceae bacterium]|nr:SRPBCC family protein [Beijerinckiaceae bacterium]
MKIRNEIRIAAPVPAVWATLDDIPRVARCAPGAELLEQKEDGTCIGRVGVKLGPVALQFKGSVQFTERDEAALRVVAKAKGAEEKARGTASADVVFQLFEDNGGTKIVVESDVQLAGFIAQYGRGASLIQSTAQAIMNQFAKNLEADLNGAQAAPAGDISLAKVVAQGLWSAGKEAFRKKSSAD